MKFLLGIERKWWNFLKNSEWGEIVEEEVLIEHTSKYMKMSNKILLGMSAR